MSANNYIRISKYPNPKKYVVTDANYDTFAGTHIGQTDTLEEAIKLATDYQIDNIVEYGIHFDESVLKP